MKEKRNFKQFLKDLLEIYIEFAKIGLFTIGGGMAMMPMMQRELIEKRKWMTDEDLIDYYAIGQSTPGVIAVNVSTFIGYKRCGVIGGIFGTLGMITPSLIIISILASLINSIDEIPIVKKALIGVNIAVASLLTYVTFNFAKKTVKNFWSVILLLLSFSAIFFFKVPSWAVIFASIFLGILISIFSSKKHINLCKKNNEKTSEKSE